MSNKDHLGRKSASDAPEERTAAMIARHLAFWELEQVARPLIHVNVEFCDNLALDEIAAEGDVLQPDLRPPAQRLEREDERWRQLEDLDSDLFRPVSPFYSGLQMEAGIGMPLTVMGGSIWPEPMLAQNRPLEELHIGCRQEWLAALVEDVRNAVRQAAGRYPVQAPWMRAPADMITALIGTGRALVELYDHPRQMQALVETLADACCEIMLLLQRQLEPFHDGFVLSAGHGIYAPGPCACISEDSTSFVSRQMFEEFFQAADIRISQALPYGFVHRHSLSRQNIPCLLGLNPNWILETSMDQMGPPLEELLPVFRQLQAAGRRMLINLYAELASEQIPTLARELSPRGLCIVITAAGVEQARGVLDFARDTWAAA